MTNHRDNVLVDSNHHMLGQCLSLLATIIVIVKHVSRETKRIVEHAPQSILVSCFRLGFVALVFGGWLGCIALDLFKVTDGSLPSSAS